MPFNLILENVKTYNYLETKELTMMIYFAVILAAAIIGFTSGRTNEPAVGHLTSGITGFAAGLLAMFYPQENEVQKMEDYRTSTIEKVDFETTTSLFIIFLIVLFLFYLIGNYLRVEGIFNSIWGRTKQQIAEMEEKARIEKELRESQTNKSS